MTKTLAAPHKRSASCFVRARKQTILVVELPEILFALPEGFARNLTKHETVRCLGRTACTPEIADAHSFDLVCVTPRETYVPASQARRFAKRQRKGASGHGATVIKRAVELLRRCLWRFRGRGHCTKPIPRGVKGCVSQSHGSGPALEKRGGMGVQVCDVFSGGPHTALTMRCLLLLLSDGG